MRATGIHGLPLIPLLEVRERFEEGRVVARPNRFTLLVEVGDAIQRAYLANPGRLATVIKPGRRVLLTKAGGARRTAFDAFAADLGGLYATLRSTLANPIFEACIRKACLPGFEGSSIAGKEVRVEGLGRVDFVLRKGGEGRLAEVKSCTHVESGVAKFPDRPTGRGRRHLRALIDVAKEGRGCHIVFVVQRPDAERFSPFREVDPAFASLLGEASRVGVGIHALSAGFDPTQRSIYLANPRLPVVLDEAW